MDAVIFNLSIQKIITFGKTHLSKFDFFLFNEPELQEDSGDLVSTESISLIFKNEAEEVDLRFFLCCGKGLIEDYIHCKLISRLEPSLFVDFASLSQKLGRHLQELEFNSTKLPMEEFLNNYFSEFEQSFELLLGAAFIELQQRALEEPRGFSLL